jgi:hypothetical protein
MQTPAYWIGQVRFLALPACLAPAKPEKLAAWAEWSVTAYAGNDDWSETLVGWLAPRMPVRRRRGRGPIACFTDGGPYGPPLAYVGQARSSRQGLRLVAEAARTRRDLAGHL